jgi:hypothetical protein
MRARESPETEELVALKPARGRGRGHMRLRRLGCGLIFVNVERRGGR